MLKQPENMDELVYWTKRAIGDGSVKAWVFKELCPKCKKSLMGKPKDPKTGKVKIRSKEYVCESCNYTVEKKEYEETLQVNIDYKCPECGNEGEIRVPFKRKMVKGTPSIVFPCEKCNAKIIITKKMKKVGEKD